MSEYQTHDLALCAFLKTEGIGYLRIDVIEEPHWDQRRQRMTSGRAVMVFDDSETLRDTVMDYETGNARVEPQDFQKAVGWSRGRLLDAIKRHAEAS